MYSTRRHHLTSKPRHNYIHIFRELEMGNFRSRKGLILLLCTLLATPTTAPNHTEGIGFYFLQQTQDNNDHKKKEISYFCSLRAASVLTLLPPCGRTKNMHVFLVNKACSSKPTEDTKTKHRKSTKRKQTPPPLPLTAAAADAAATAAARRHSCLQTKPPDSPPPPLPKPLPRRNHCPLQLQAASTDHCTQPLLVSGEGRGKPPR